jgi:hypothetical protein
MRKYNPQKDIFSLLNKNINLYSNINSLRRTCVYINPI